MGMDVDGPVHSSSSIAEEDLWCRSRRGMARPGSPLWRGHDFAL
jgi:hypothetical protein